MNMTFRAPSTINYGTTVVLPDGSSTTVNAGGFLTADSSFLNALESAGYVPMVNPNDSLPLAKYTDYPNTAAATIAQADLVGQDVQLDMAGTLTAGAALTLPTVAQLVAAINAVAAFNVNMVIKLRVSNSGAGAFAWTLTTATGWTLNGTQTVAQGAVRDYYITFQSATAATLTSRNG